MTIGNAAFEEVLRPITGLLANSALWADGGVNYQHHFVYLADDFKVALATSGVMPIGVLMNKPTSGAAAVVAGVGSVVKLRTAAAVLIGAKLMPDTGNTGHAITATSGNYVGAIALEAGDSGDEVTAYIVGGVDKIA